MSQTGGGRVRRAREQVDALKGSLKARADERLPEGVRRWWALVNLTDAPTRAAAAAFFAAVTLPSIAVAALSFFDWAAGDDAEQVVRSLIDAAERSAGVDLSSVVADDALTPARDALRSVGVWALLVGLFSGSKAISVLQKTWSHPANHAATPERLGAVLGRLAAVVTLAGLLGTVALAHVFAPLVVSAERAVGERLIGTSAWSALAADRWLGAAIDGVVLFVAFLIVVQLASRGRVHRRALMAGGAAWLLSVTVATTGWRLFMAARSDEDIVVSGVSSGAGAMLWLYLVCLAATLSLLVSRAVAHPEQPDAD